MLDQLLTVANKYATGLETVEKRRTQWLNKYVALRDHLTEVAEYLNKNTTYKQGFFVDTLHAFNEDIHGTSAKMPSITFRSGGMPMLVTFRNSMGEKKSFIEDGFHISFNPTITGQIIVLLLPHQSDLNKEPLPYNTLAIINDPEQLSMDIADQIVIRGMEAAFHTSFTGMGGSADNPIEENAAPATISGRNPIGFKRYETTEKIN